MKYALKVTNKHINIELACVQAWNQIQYTFTKFAME